jgi:hypothetical protein
MVGFPAHGGGWSDSQSEQPKTMDPWDPWGWAEMAVRSLSFFVIEWSRTSKADLSDIPPRGKYRFLCLPRETNVHGRPRGDTRCYCGLPAAAYLLCKMQCVFPGSVSTFLSPCLCGLAAGFMLGFEFWGARDGSLV